MNTVFGKGLGWHRDLPDHRDYTPETEGVSMVLAAAPLLKGAPKAVPGAIDLRAWCSPIEDQGDLGSCTANAAVGMYEYYEKRARGTYVNASRLFIYKVTRGLMGVTGDSGAYLRDTMKSLAVFGSPPERYWPYDISRFEDEPSSFCYAFGQAYQATRYYRLDPAGTNPADAHDRIIRHLAAGLPSMFGFSVYSSIAPMGDGRGEIPMPTAGDSLLGGHAIVAVGYDNAKKIGKAKGAYLIRNSWGTAWGDGGYGWLPYAYVASGLADDFWSMVKGDYLNTGLFD